MSQTTTGDDLNGNVPPVGGGTASVLGEPGANDGDSAGGPGAGKGGSTTETLSMALAFVTEFNTNTQIFVATRGRRLAKVVVSSGWNSAQRSVPLTGLEPVLQPPEGCALSTELQGPYCFLS